MIRDRPEPERIEVELRGEGETLEPVDRRARNGLLELFFQEGPVRVVPLSRVKEIREFRGGEGSA